jgi:predicted O-methyltransferase YrrM
MLPVGHEDRADYAVPCSVRPSKGAPMCAAVTPPTAASWTYAEEWLPEEDFLAQARVRAGELGCPAIGRGGAHALTLVAALLEARAVVEIGTGVGISGLALLRGMRQDGVLTSVDVEAENQRAARATFVNAGISPSRTRLITGRALEVLPRLTDGAYDIVFVDGDKSEYSAYLTQALRLLRPGGAVLFDNALWHDKVADPAQRDPQTVALRELVTTVREDERLTASLLPVGDGLLVAVKRDRA